MADYHSPTVVTPSLPVADMTALERLILSLCFDEEPDGDGHVDLHSRCGPSHIVTLAVEDLRVACDATPGPGRDDSCIGDHVVALLARHDAQVLDDLPADIDVDLTVPGIGWAHIFQDIVRRSMTLEEIVVTAAWTCSKMRPDGFGGSVTLITPDVILYRATDDMLQEMREQPQPPGAEDADGHETRRRLEAMAAAAGWDSFTLLLLIARWLNENRHTGTLIDHLDRLVEAGRG